MGDIKSQNCNKYGIFVLKTNYGYQQHIYQEQSILRQIRNLEYWRMLLSGNSILFFSPKIVERFGKPDKDLFVTII